MDPLRIYVVFDHNFDLGERWQRWLTNSLSGIGMRRDECRFGIPVHGRFKPWGGPQASLPDPRHPRHIRLDDATRNVILLLVDKHMTGFALKRWLDYVAVLQQQMAARLGQDLLIPVLLNGEAPSFNHLPQGIRNATPDTPDNPEQGNRFLLQLLNTLLVHRQPAALQAIHKPGHGIFVSHAKLDGWKTAKRMVDALLRAGDGVQPAFFLDTDSLASGSDYERRFVETIGSGSLLALVTDAYHSRPWCRWEVLTAKRLGRPIVVVDLSTGRIERTHPYLGNVPTHRITIGGIDTASISETDIEQITLALLSEALRFELWREYAQQKLAGRDACQLLARPPELADLVVSAVRSRSQATIGWIVYPDPPLGQEETDLLAQAFPHLRVFSLAQALARL